MFSVLLCAPPPKKNVSGNFAYLKKIYIVPTIRGMFTKCAVGYCRTVLSKPFFMWYILFPPFSMSRIAVSPGADNPQHNDMDDMEPNK